MLNRKQKVEPTSVSKPCSNAMLAAVRKNKLLTVKINNYGIRNFK